MAKLPDDFPHLAVLHEAGINTPAQLSKYADDYTKIPGIGDAKAPEIAAAVAAQSQPEDEAPLLVQCTNPACGHINTVNPCEYCGQ